MKVDVSVIYFCGFLPITCNLCNNYFSHFTLHQLSNCLTVEASRLTSGLPGAFYEVRLKLNDRVEAANIVQAYNFVQLRYF